MMAGISSYLRLIKRRKQLLHSFYEILTSEKQTQKRFILREGDMMRMFDENTQNTHFDRHYIYHPAWAIRKVKEINPQVHIDIGSTLQFCSMLSAFYEVKFFDYRPANIKLSHLESGFQDLTKLGFENNSISSLSCMHTVEHIGLGRYGDKINYDADLKAMQELARVLAKNGNLLFVVPVGREARIQFNAHRIYTKEMILACFANFGLSLIEFVLIPEDETDGGLIINPSEELLNKQAYGCGCFWFVKK